MDCRIPIRYVENPKISFGCPLLDGRFGGGLPCGSITEIVGESGVGKTQICLQFALNVQLLPHRGGLGGTSLYLRTEFSFPFRRLHQLALQREQLQQNPLDRVFVQPLSSLDTLEDILPRLESVVARDNIKLIIIDSVAALFRGAFQHNGKEMKDRMNKFFKISAKLKCIAYKFGIAIITTNQVTYVIPNSDVFRIGEWLMTSERNVSAALGMSWANCINTRFFMSNVGTKRRLQVVFAPHLPNVSAEYGIENKGVCGYNIC